jgi:hypothetical protein
MHHMRLSVLFRLSAGLCLTAAVALCASATSSLRPGKVELKSAGQLVFGPDGVLFVGDALGAAVYAIDTEDTKPAGSVAPLEIKAVNEKIAALLGAMPDQILINDIKVNPISKRIYLSVSRGRGPDAAPVILRIDGSGKMSEFSMDRVNYSMVTLPDAPEPRPGAAPVKGGERVNGVAQQVMGPGLFGAGNPRAWTITDMSYLNGKVIVAGVSNEEFSSDLHSISFPFQQAQKGTSSVEIWHSNHGRYETQAPIRTLIPYSIGKQDYILATYACTPLVKMPVSALKPGAKVVGETIAEMGDHNMSLEMFSYRKEGHDFILVANSLRGLIKLSADGLGASKPIVPKSPECAASREPAVSVREGTKNCGVETGGLPFTTLPEFKGVVHLAKADDIHAVILQDSKGADELDFAPGNATIYTPKVNGTLDLKTIQLP